MSFSLTVGSNTASPMLLKLAASISVNQVEIGYGSKIASYQHFGTSRGIPPRKLIPDSGLPPDWEAPIKQVLEAAIKGLDLSGAFAQIGMMGSRRLQSSFNSDSDPYGGGWTGLAPSTLAKKRNPKMLQESGGMIASLNHQVG